MNLRVIRVDRIDSPRKAYQPQVFYGVRAGSEAFRSSDNRNGSRRKKATQILFQDEAS